MKTNVTGTKKTVIFYSILNTVFLSPIISILFVFNVSGQGLSDQKYSVQEVNKTLGEILHILEQKTNFTFSYLNNQLPLNEKATLDIKDESLQQILEILSNRFELSFARIRNIITVKKNEKKKEESNEKNNPNTYGILRGSVRDSLTSESLPYASIFIREMNAGPSTDNRGYFVIPSIPAQKEYSIIVSYIGYKAKKVIVFIQENKITDVNIYISKSTINVNDIVVTGERKNEEKVTIQKFSLREIEDMSYGVETDVMRSIQLQPGVQSAGDVSGRYYVRGGASNENLVLLNETPIYNPFHALGIFSVIDPDMINSVEFYNGGFGSKYNGRLSSVMDIITKDGNKNDFGASAAVSQLTVKTELEGPIPNGSFILTGRKSISNEILKKFTNNNSIPIDFYDASFKVNYSLPQDYFISKFTLFGFLSGDKIDYKNQLQSNYHWSNSHFGFNWFSSEQNSPLFADLTFYYSNFSGGEIPNLSNNRYIENKVDDYTLKMDFNYVLNDRSEYYGGFKITYLKTNLFLYNLSGTPNDIGSDGFAFGGYVGIKLLNLDKIKADFGSRLNVMNLTQGSALFFEPRANVIYGLLPTLNLKAAWGIYQQELVTISDENEPLALFEPWIITPKYLKTSSSVHYIGGMEYYLTERLKINIEGFYKAMHNLAVLNDVVVFPTDPQLINASGKSYGGDIAVNYHDRWINTQLSYSYSWTTKKTGDIEYHPRYDCRNAVKIFINCDLGNDWRAGISWNFNSGLPYTQFLGYYDRSNSSNIFTWPSIFTNHEYYPLLGGRNNATAPDYHRLDINLSKKFQLEFMKLSMDLSLINVYNRKNIFYYNIKTGERVNMLPFFPSIEIKAEL